MDRSSELLKKKSVRKALAEKWKDIDGVVRCCSCGSSQNIEWHHAIPLEVGGQDVFTNFVPACHSCHMAAHSWQDQRKEKLANRKPNIKGGRKPIVPENYKDLLHDYIFCKIGREELGMKWNGAMGSSSGDMPEAIKHLSDKSWFKAYLNELNIEKIHNGIDAHRKRTHNPKRKTNGAKEKGYIIYKNGKKEIFEIIVPEKPRKLSITPLTPRSRDLPENYKALLDDFIHCRIGFKELLCHWDVDPISPASLVNYKKKTWYRDYLEELGISRITNLIDKPSANAKKRGIKGTIYYKTGKVEDIYCDTLAKAE